MKKQNKQPVVLNGGLAIPLGNNYFYMKGRKHSAGGIDIDKDLEVEDGEIVHAGKTSTKVFSSLPFLNGISPVEKLLSGEKPNNVFAEQERFKDKNGINDDGTRKKENGGKSKKLIEKTIAGISDSTKSIIPSISMALNIGSRRVADSLERLMYGERYDKDTERLKNIGYIGGSTINTRKKYWNTDKRVRQFVDSVATSHGLAPHLLRHSLSNEGFTDDNIKQINQEYLRRVRGVPRPTIFKLPINDIFGENKLNNNFGTGYIVYGTDDSGRYYDTYPITKKLIDDSNEKSNAGIDVNYRVTDIQKEDDTWTDYIEGESAKNNIIIHSAVLRGIRDNIKKKYPKASEKELDDLALYHYNYGPNAKKPKNVAIMRNGRYNSNTYKAMGGEQKKQSRGLYSVTSNGVTRLYSYPSTGESAPRSGASQTKDKIKAELGWWKRKAVPWLKDNKTDLASNVFNLAGTLTSTLINDRMLKNMKAPEVPIGKQAAKLKTNYNITPQLTNVNENIAEYNRSIDANTNSSQVGLNRKRNIMLSGIDSKNQLYATKENEETKLINADVLNQQEVANSNIDSYNQWLDKKVAFDNAINEKRVENIISGINNMTIGIQDTITRKEKRKAEALDALSILAANPNVNPKLFESQFRAMLGNKKYEEIINRQKKKTKVVNTDVTDWIKSLIDDNNTFKYQ